MRNQNDLEVYMPPKREITVEDVLRDQLRMERMRRMEAETMRDEFAGMTVAGGIVMILMTIALFYLV